MIAATGGLRGSLVPATASRRPRPWPGAGARLLVPLVLAISLLSCGTGAARHRLTAGPCPARAPVAAPPAPAGRSPAAPLIRPDPVIAVICQYVAGLPASKRRLTPVLRVVLPSAAADGLAALLDDARPLPPAARRCASFPFSQLIEFGYRAGPVARAAVTFCSSGAEVTAGRRSASFGPPLSDGLFFYTSMRRQDRGLRTPDLIGLPAAVAAAVAASHHFSLNVMSAAVDARAPFDHVIFQSLPPAAVNAGPGNQVSVIVAVPPAPACRRPQLRLRYRAGGFGTGNDFGAIIFTDAGPRPCQLAGRVQVTGLDPQGRPVTSTIAVRITPPGVLSARAAAIPAHAGPPPGELAYYWMLAAEYRDGPPSVDGGYCQPLWVIPAAWRVALGNGATFTIRNADPAGASPMSRSGGLITCQGRLGADQTISYLTP